MCNLFHVFRGEHRFVWLLAPHSSHLLSGRSLHNPDNTVNFLLLISVGVRSGKEEIIMRRLNIHHGIVLSSVILSLLSLVPKMFVLRTVRIKPWHAVMTHMK